MGFGPSSNNTSGLCITGVQLEPGPVATPFEHRDTSMDLAICQRYYQTNYANKRFSSGSTTPEGADNAYMFQPSNTADTYYFPLFTEMRVAPTMAFKTRTNLADNARRTGGSASNAPLSTIQTNSKGFSFKTTAAASGRYYAFYWEASAEV